MRIHNRKSAFFLTTSVAALSVVIATYSNTEDDVRIEPEYVVKMTTISSSQSIEWGSFAQRIIPATNCTYNGGNNSGNGGQGGRGFDIDGDGIGDVSVGTGHAGATRVDNCDNCGGSRSSGSSSGGGGFSCDWICFLEGTRIFMADGTIKSIEDLKIGDVTVTGRVIQTIASTGDGGSGPSPDASQRLDHQTKELHVYDSIAVTGNHVVHENGQWLPVHSTIGGKPHFAAGYHVYYNLLVENGIIPVISNNSELHYFADSRNNACNEAEIGYAKLGLGSLNVKQIA